MGKNGQKLFFLCDFFAEPIFRRVLDQKFIFCGFFFAFWGLGLIHFVATARNHACLELWDCSPFLHRHTNVDQLHSGIAVHSTDKHQQAWFRSTTPHTPHTKAPLSSAPSTVEGWNHEATKPNTAIPWLHGLQRSLQLHQKSFHHHIPRHINPHNHNSRNRLSVNGVQLCIEINATPRFT